MRPCLLRIPLQHQHKSGKLQCLSNTDIPCVDTVANGKRDFAHLYSSHPIRAKVFTSHALQKGRPKMAKKIVRESNLYSRYRKRTLISERTFRFCKG